MKTRKSHAVDQLGPQQEHAVEEENRVGACLHLLGVEQQVGVAVVDLPTVEPAAGLSERTEQLGQKSVVVERIFVTTPRRLGPPPVALDPRAEEALDRGADHFSSTAAKRDRQLVGEHGLACRGRSVDRHPHRVRARDAIDRVDDGGNGLASRNSRPQAHCSSLRTSRAQAAERLPKSSWRLVQRDASFDGSLQFASLLSLGLWRRRLCCCLVAAEEPS